MLKLDRVMRHETTLHRQIDTSVKMLGRELPRLFEGRVREDLIRRMNETERSLKDDPYLDQWITQETQKRSSLPTAPPSLDLSTLDTAPIAANCENEPSPTPAPPESRRDFPSLGISPALQSRDMSAKCQNEPAPAPSPLSPPELGAGGRSSACPISISAIRKARQLKRQQNCQNEPVPTPSSPAPHDWGGRASSSSRCGRTL